jgi:tripartite-type tricarboxylate transporter receptor subunit TctC
MIESPLSRRTLLQASAALLASPAFGQQFPSKPVTLVCPFSAGGAADAQLRALGAALSKQLGQTVIIDNKVGAAGTLGPGYVAGLPPDGYTLGMATAIALLRQPFITPTRYDPAKDFTYVTGITRFEIGLAVRADAPWRTFEEFIKDAKTKQDKLSYATSGIATAQHTAMLQLGDAFGIKWTHIPYKGSGDACNALLGGHVDVLADVSNWASFVDAGKFRLLALYGDKRLKRWPNVPTLKELGHNVVASVPWGIVGPVGIDPARVKFLSDSLHKAMLDPTFTSELGMLGQEPWNIEPEAYRAYMISRIPVEKEIVAKYGLRSQ